MAKLRAKLTIVACAAALAATVARAGETADQDQTAADSAASDAAAADVAAADAAAVEGASGAAGAPGADERATAAESQDGGQAGSGVSADGKAVADFVADGSRVSVRNGDFTVQPPRGWEVYTHLPSLTLLMQIPYQPGMKYQRTIQVASFSGSRFIDEVTAKEYEDVIVRKFSATSTSIDGYKIRNHMPIEMADGRQGLLFYTEFTLEGVSMMQAHILVSSQQRHYLMTFTDLAEHFENDGASRFLTEAWDSMISVQLGSRTPARFESAVYIMVIAGLLAALATVVMLVRRARSGRSYRDYANGRSFDADVSAQGAESYSTTEFSNVSRVSDMTDDTQDLDSVHSLTEPPKKVAAKQLGKGAPKRRPKPVTALPESSLAEEPFDSQDDIAI